MDQKDCKPFLKWAGGKTQLMRELARHLPHQFNRYFEPFLGSGALYFHIQPARAVLSDVNADLINTYNAVRDNVDDLVRSLKGHVYERLYFYLVRDIDRRPEFNEWDSVKKASRLIYLNKTCFNGLYRVNSEGHFNTPFGRYKNPRILDEANLRVCSEVLRGADLRQCPFEALEDEMKAGDFVYFDPPYLPLSKTSSFTAYSHYGFDLHSQTRLRDMFERITRKGVHAMLSNSSSPDILELYSGFTAHRVKAKRAINSRASGRGPIDELIITNY